MQNGLFDIDNRRGYLMENGDMLPRCSPSHETVGLSKQGGGHDVVVCRS